MVSWLYARMAKITFYEMKAWETAYVQKHLSGHELVFCEEPLTEKTLSHAEGADVVSVFIHSHIDKGLMERLPSLGLIATRSTGFDHIDLHAAREKGITVATVPRYGDNTVAEHTFALILSLTRKIHASFMRLYCGSERESSLTGFDLKGKTIGIIGGGKIGLHVARIAKAFSMDVLVYDINHDPFMAEILDFSYAQLADLLRESDIVSLHAPLNDATFHLLDRQTMASMKDGAILINTARGGLVDTQALLECLEAGKISGAGLDVIEGEEEVKEEKDILNRSPDAKTPESIRAHKILEMENVVFTPHNAFNSREALYRILDTTIRNVRDHIGADR